MHWIIQDIFGEETNNLIKYLDDYQIVNDKTYLSKPSFDTCIIRGSIDFIEKFSKIPFSVKLLTLENYTCSQYYNYIEGLINSDCIFLPWGKLKYSKDIIFKCFGGDRVFIRPNSGKKIFTGTSVGKKWWNKELEIVKNFPENNILDTDLVLISSFKEIVKEYRVLMYRNEIIDYSIYNGETHFYDNKLIKHYCSKNTYYPDIFYTIDIGIGDNFSGILEINSFVSAGLYEMDFKKVVSRINSLLERG